MPTLYIMHENSLWNAPLVRILAAQGWTCVEWDLRSLHLPLHGPPPAKPCVVLNRFSPSSFWRTGPQALAVATQRLHWLQLHGIPVVSGLRALELETSKALQHLQCQQHSVPVPRTVICTADQLEHALQQWGEAPYVIKPNCGGSGHDITLQGTTAVRSPDCLVLVQEYVDSPSNTLIRLEYVDGALLYALQVRTSKDDFNNCPADHCTVEHCPVGGSKFTRLADFPETESERRLDGSLRRLLRANRIDIAGAEAIQDAAGRWWVIDINCVNTNYNRSAELACGAGERGAERVAALLRRRLTDPRTSGSPPGCEPPPPE
jgi:carbamoylphosphate synthase large subunit